MTIKVTRRWLVHEGGTKFYQLFLFSREATRALPGDGLVQRSCTLTHWGTMRVAKGSYQPRPVNGGQVRHLAGTDFGIKSREKTEGTPAKGCYRQRVEDRFQSFTTAADFEKWLIEQVGAIEAHPIMVSLSLRGSDTRLETADGEDPIEALFGGAPVPAKRKPKPALDTKPIARPSGWGDW